MMTSNINNVIELIQSNDKFNVLLGLSILCKDYDLLMSFCRNYNDYFCILYDNVPLLEVANKTSRTTFIFHNYNHDNLYQSVNRWGYYTSIKKIDIKHRAKLRVKKKFLKQLEDLIYHYSEIIDNANIFNTNYSNISKARRKGWTCSSLSGKTFIISNHKQI